MDKGIVFKFIIVIVLIAALTIGVGFFAYFTNGFKTELMRFYVEIDGVKILNTANDFKLHKNNEPLTVNVKHILDENENYTVTVVPNVIDGLDFNFNVDGDMFSFQNETDLTNGFIIEKSNNKFTINPKGGLGDILKSCYPNNLVEVNPGKSYENMFSLVITSHTKQSIKVNFSVIEDIYGIILDQEEIEF